MPRRKSGMGLQEPNSKSTPSASTQGAHELNRAIGYTGSTAIVIGTIIGSGIFLVPHDIVQQVGSVKALMMVWLIGGVLSLAGALSLAELGAANPSAGGIYVYLRDAYGKLFAFLYGWALLLVINSGSVATLAVAFGIYSTTFVPLSPGQQKLVAIGAITLLTVVNILGVRKAAAVQTLFTFAKLAGLAIIMGAAFLIHPIIPVQATHAWSMPHPSVSSYGVAMIGVLWAYEGWHMLSFAVGEVKEPSRVIPRSYLVGTLVVVGVYLGANLAYLRVLSVPVIAEHQRVAAKTMEVLAGPRGATFVSALILCSIFGAMNGTILGGPRAYFAMARDGVLFPSVGRVHPRYATPVVALLIQGGWSILLASSGTYKQLYTYVIFTGWLFYGAATFAVVVLRHKHPDMTRPYRVWGYPVLPIAFSVAALVIVANALVRSPKESGIGLILVLIGLPMFLIWKRKRAVTSDE